MFRSLLSVALSKLSASLLAALVAILTLSLFFTPAAHGEDELHRSPVDLNSVTILRNGVFDTFTSINRNLVTGAPKFKTTEYSTYDDVIQDFRIAIDVVRLTKFPENQTGMIVTNLEAMVDVLDVIIDRAADKLSEETELKRRRDANPAASSGLLGDFSTLQSPDQRLYSVSKLHDRATKLRTKITEKIDKIKGK